MADSAQWQRNEEPLNGVYGCMCVLFAFCVSLGVFMIASVVVVVSFSAILYALSCTYKGYSQSRANSLASWHLQNVMANIFNTTTKCTDLHLPDWGKFAALKSYCKQSSMGITDLTINQSAVIFQQKTANKQTMEVHPVKTKLKREKPNKKWTEKELKIILNYLQEAPEIEAPTAQIFYKKMIAVSGIDASWDLIRYKVRHLKASFKKANDWRRSTGAGLLESDKGASSVEGKVLQMCPHYHQLQEIFGEKRNATAEYDVVNTGSSEELETSHMFSICSGDGADFVETHFDECGFVEVVDKDCEVVCDVECSTSSSPAHTLTTSKRAESLPSSVPQKAKDFAAKLKKFGPKSSAAYLSAFQADRAAMFQTKVEWEKEKFEREFPFNEKKLQLEEEKVKSENEYRNRKLDLKKLEIEKDERMRIKQMEKEERLERYALELKWKHNEQK